MPLHVYRLGQLMHQQTELPWQDWLAPPGQVTPLLLQEHWLLVHVAPVSHCTLQPLQWMGSLVVSVSHVLSLPPQLAVPAAHAVLAQEAVAGVAPLQVHICRSFTEPLAVQELQLLPQWFQTVHGEHAPALQKLPAAQSELEEQPQIPVARQRLLLASVEQVLVPTLHWHAGVAAGMQSGVGLVHAGPPPHPPEEDEPAPELDAAAELEDPAAELEDPAVADEEEPATDEDAARDEEAPADDAVVELAAEEEEAAADELPREEEVVADDAVLLDPALEEDANEDAWLADDAPAEEPPVADEPDPLDVAEDVASDDEELVTWPLEPPPMMEASATPPQ